MHGNDQKGSPSPQRITWLLLGALARVAAFAICGGLGAIAGQWLMCESLRMEDRTMLFCWFALHVGCCGLVFLAWPTVRQALAIFRARERWEWLTLTSAALVVLALLSYAVATGAAVLSVW